MITKQFAEKFTDELAKETGIPGDKVFFELQKNYSFLLVNIELDYIISKSEMLRLLKMAQNLAGRLVPKSDNDYTWMINLKVNREVVNSVFGGDSRFLDSGLI